MEIKSAKGAGDANSRRGSRLPAAGCFHKVFHATHKDPMKKRGNPHGKAGLVRKSLAKLRIKVSRVFFADETAVTEPQSDQLREQRQKHEV